MTRRPGRTVRRHRMPFGAEPLPDGRVRFRLWAPAHKAINLVLTAADSTLPMAMAAEGFHELVTDQAHPGSRYVFELPSGQRLPDPASRFQPEDVHGPSEVIDPAAYAWGDAHWRGRPWHDTILYELHVGSFTPEGSFRAAIDKLDHLVDLGVTAVELMPVADFPGRRNWGYDGVSLFAPDATYGRPENLKALIDAAHQRGLMVFLDVVYNHFGPEGNYLPAFAPQIFTDRHQTPWGAAINYDGPDSRAVRAFVIHNALYWIKEFHFDGLRLDAVHAVIDESPVHLLTELAEHIHQRIGDARHVHLVLENDANQAHFLERRPDDRPVWYAAQWNDDLHHGLHVVATGESGGYYADYAGDVTKLGRALAEGFAYQGDASAYRNGEKRGGPSRHLPPTAFVSFIQNHDQIGNRAFGERITVISRPEAMRAIAAIYLLAPQVPMLFMGEEWGAAQPFPFFCDFGSELAEAVRSGRREEFAKFPEFQDPEARERIPDPAADDTFWSAKLDWGDVSRGPHADWLDWYRRILAVRRAEIVPRLPRIKGRAGRYELIGEAGLRVQWTMDNGGSLGLIASLSDQGIGMEPNQGRPVWVEGDWDRGSGRIGPWTVVFITEGSG